ncbi:MAG TPA: MBL fold metallo-hydrolase [Pseudonocardiaceae bacterium]|jgi:glyoxylase-like metal-dependent hydrolase (beta-lactamase superfamily II)|nr:MBL fold metallo-hydrolase [Pseudonocardiaceae bacterium]
MRAPTITPAADNAYLVSGQAVNWTILTDGDDVTLIDSGYPADYSAVEASLESIGHRVEQIAAILVTHTHIDHIGSLPRLSARTKAPILVSPAELPLAHGAVRESATPLDIVSNLWRPGFLGWSLYLVRAGALAHVRLPDAQPFPADGALDVPGHPTPIATPGHTSGHTCYHLPETGVLVTGDTLITAHQTSAIVGPQLLLPLFSHDQRATVAALDTLESLDADVILPGHGPLHRGPIREAAAQARSRLRR